MNEWIVDLPTTAFLFGAALLVAGTGKLARHLFLRRHILKRLQNHCA